MTTELDNDGDDVPLEYVLERLLDAREEELHTALPGRVVSYNAAAQTADVAPMIQRAIPRADGGTHREPMPTIRAVPVAWPRAGDWFVHMPLAAGDFVLLVCCERDIARWRVTGELSDPIDRRGHHLAHAVAIPGVYPRTRELGDTPSDAMVIGRDGGATIRIKANGDIDLGSAAADFVALASKVDAVVNAIVGTTIVPGDGGAAIKGAVSTAWTAVSSTSAAAKTRAQ